MTCSIYENGWYVSELKMHLRVTFLKILFLECLSVFFYLMFLFNFVSLQRNFKCYAKGESYYEYEWELKKMVRTFGSGAANKLSFV